MAGETKYHINPNTGRAGVCRAHKRPCEFGGDTGQENHYNSKEEAEKAIVEKLSATHSAVPKSASKQKSDGTSHDKEKHDRLLKNVKRSVEKNDKLIKDAEQERNELLKNKDKLVELRDASSITVAEEINEAIHKLDGEIQQADNEYDSVVEHAREYKEKYKNEIKEIKRIERERVREIEAKLRTEEARSYASKVDNASCGSSYRIGPNEMRARGRASARSSCGGSGGGSARPRSSC